MKNLGWNPANAGFLLFYIKIFFFMGVSLIWMIFIIDNFLIKNFELGCVLNECWLVVLLLNYGVIYIISDGTIMANISSILSEMYCITANIGI